MASKSIFLAATVLLAIIRGSSYLFIKDLIVYSTPFEIVFFRFFTTGIILLLVFRNHIRNIKKHDIYFGCLAGVFLFSAFAFQTCGLEYTTVSKQSFLTSLYIVIVPLLNFLIFRKRLSKKIIGIFGIILVGLYFISFENLHAMELSLNYGDFLTLLCAVGFALNILLFSKVHKFEIDIMNVTMVQMLSTGILAFLFQMLFEQRLISFHSFNFSLVYLILVCTMLNFSVQNICQKYISAHIMGLILSTEAIWGTIFAILFLGEIINLNFIVGTSLMMSGILLIQYLEKDKADDEALP